MWFEFVDWDFFQDVRCEFLKQVTKASEHSWDLSDSTIDLMVHSVDSIELPLQPSNRFRLHLDLFSAISWDEVKTHSTFSWNAFQKFLRVQKQGLDFFGPIVFNQDWTMIVTFPNSPVLITWIWSINGCHPMSCSANV